MLTGDKGETAMEIGLRCGLYDRDSMKIMKVVETTEHSALLADLQKHVRFVEDCNQDQDTSSFAMAVAGSCLPTIYESPQLSACIKVLFANCEAVIVYRSSPSQKAETVKYIR